MAGPINLTETDFEEIRQNLVDYLKSTEKYSDYDFEGSNLSGYPEPSVISGTIECLFC